MGGDTPKRAGQPGNAEAGLEVMRHVDDSMSHLQATSDIFQGQRKGCRRSPAISKELSDCDDGQGILVITTVAFDINLRQRRCTFMNSDKHVHPDEWAANRPGLAGRRFSATCWRSDESDGATFFSRGCASISAA